MTKSTERSADLALLDTNVLVGALLTDDYRYPTARPLLEQAHRSQVGFCLVPQVLAEFYAVITNPQKVTAVKTSAEAVEAVRALLAYPGLRLLFPPVDSVERWADLLARHPATGPRFFDVQLVAAMLGNDVRTLYTYNVSDFEPFTRIAGIEVIDPRRSVPGGGRKGMAEKPTGPREIGGRRGERTSTRESGPRRPSAAPPGLVCRRLPDSGQWQVLLSADDECRITAVKLDGRLLDMVNHECCLPALTGRLTIEFRDEGKKEVSLFDDKPLIFKLPKNWVGEGHRIAALTKGYFVVIVPNEWERTGHVPVEPEGCTDTDFRAHYFFWDGGDAGEDVGGFRQRDIIPTPSGFELTGQRVFDNSTDGDLFSGAVPNLELSSNVAWVRVGEEKKGGWKGENFKPTEKTLPEVLNGRYGRFFIRVYDSQRHLLDSGAFRYLRDLKQILVNGEPFAETTLLVPSPTGHPSTKVSVIGVDGTTVRLISPHAEVQGGDLVIDPRPDADCVRCTLASEAGCVDTVLELPRIWWCVARDESSSGEWRDTPLEMTRQEFREHAYAKATVVLRFPRRIKSVQVGFDDESSQVSRKGEKDIAIPLRDFVDCRQITRRLHEDASFNVRCAGEIVTPIRVSSDPVPEIVSFTAEPATVNTGEKVILRWATRNTEAGHGVIEPEVGGVESSGYHEVTPLETVTYTLRLTACDMDDVTKTVVATVNPPSQPDEKLIAQVRIGKRRRDGRGFSNGELRDAGLRKGDAALRLIPIDKRRRTVHRGNVEKLRKMIHG